LFAADFRTMSSKHYRRKCRCCKVSFIPDRRNSGRQLFCPAPGCRQASKAASQRRWLNKIENRKYFRDPSNVERVRAWRKAHPGYWQQSKTASKPPQPAQTQPVNSGTRSCNAPERDLNALQDFVLIQDPAFVGLISLVTGSTLQEDIAAVGRNLLLQGRNILGLNFREKHPPSYDPKTTHPTRSRSPSAAQL
jgi:hypothetical protein